MTDYIKKTGDDFGQLRWMYKYVEDTKGFIAGGAFKNVFNKEKVKDIDIFFNNTADWAEAVRKYDKDEENFERVYENPRVIAFNDKRTDTRIELIGSDLGDEAIDQLLFGTVEQTLDQFDFTITKLALVPRGTDLEEFVVIYHPDFFLHLLTKRLVIDEEHELVRPISTFERTLRYTGYGYRMCRNSKTLLLSFIRDQEEFVPEQLGQSLYDGID